jgi:tyrosine-protein kinase Etk/Wzc
MKLNAISEQVKEIEAQGEHPQEIHVLDLLIILSKHRKFIFCVTIGLAILTAAILLLVSNQYTAATVVMPPSQPSSVGSAMLSQLGGAGAGALASLAGGSLGIKNPSEMYVSLFRSRTVEDSVIQRFNLQTRYREKKMSSARSAFEEHSSVALGAKDGLIRITMRDRDPRLAADIANDYVEEFRKLSANLAITEASQRRMFFEQQLKDAKEKLSEAEEAMKKTQESTGVLQVDSQAKALIDSAATLRAQEVAKEVQIQAMRSFATENNPELVMAKEQLAALQVQLAKLAGKDSGSEFIVPKGRAPEAGMEYLRKLRDLKYNETVFELLAKQFEIAKLDEAKQGAVIQVVDPAVVPDKKSSPMRSLILLIVAFLGFVGAIFAAFVMEQWGQMRSSPEHRDRLETLKRAWSRRAPEGRPIS